MISCFERNSKQNRLCNLLSHLPTYFNRFYDILYTNVITFPIISLLNITSKILLQELLSHAPKTTCFWRTWSPQRPIFRCLIWRISSKFAPEKLYECRWENSPSYFPINILLWGYSFLNSQIYSTPNYKHLAFVVYKLSFFI